MKAKETVRRSIPPRSSQPAGVDKNPRAQPEGS